MTRQIIRTRMGAGQPSAASVTPTQRVTLFRGRHARLEPSSGGGSTRSTCSGSGADHTARRGRRPPRAPGRPPARRRARASAVSATALPRTSRANTQAQPPRYAVRLGLGHVGVRVVDRAQQRVGLGRRPTRGTSARRTSLRPAAAAMSATQVLGQPAGGERDQLGLAVRQRHPGVPAHGSPTPGTLAATAVHLVRGQVAGRRRPARTRGPARSRAVSAASSAREPSI